MRQAQPRGESSRRGSPPPPPHTHTIYDENPVSIGARPTHPNTSPAAKRDPILQGVRPACAALPVGAIFPHQRGSETTVFRAPPQAQTGCDGRGLAPGAVFAAKPAPPDAPIARIHRSAPAARRSGVRRFRKRVEEMESMHKFESRNQSTNESGNRGEEEGEGREESGGSDESDERKGRDWDSESFLGRLARQRRARSPAKPTAPRLEPRKTIGARAFPSQRAVPEIEARLKNKQEERRSEIRLTTDTHDQTEPSKTDRTN